MQDRARILIAASTGPRATALAKALEFVNRRVDVVSGAAVPKTFDPYRLLVCELGPRLKRMDHLLRGLRSKAHVVLILPHLDMRWITYYLRDTRINHILLRSPSFRDLTTVVDKLESGQIFGLDRYLPTCADLSYRRIDSFASRCAVLEEIERLLVQERLRGRLRRAAIQAAEELVMNAMYQAPVDTAGARIFEQITPRARIRRKTPRPVSLRYAVHDNCFFVSARDRFGSFRREDLAHYLLRCVTEETQIEEKKLGAGLGLYLVTSASRRMVINVLPNRVSEFICVLEAPREQESPLLQLSVTTQVPMTTAIPKGDTSEVSPLSEYD